MTPSSIEKCVIINADDFGFSQGVSRGIILAHQQGLVTSTTVAANMPAAEASLGMLKDSPGLGVGVHLNCTQGPALSELGKQMLARSDGWMNFSATGIIADCIRQPGLLRAVEAEFDAQIRWMLDHGLKPTHLDTHRHSHAFCPIFKAVCRLARQYDIPFVRRHREKLPGRWPACPAKQKRVSRILNAFGWINARRDSGLLATAGTWGVAHTGVLDADWFVLAAERIAAGHDGAIMEIMVHPGLPSDDLDASLTRLLESRQKELAALTDNRAIAAFKERKVNLTHYGHLRERNR